MQETKREQTHDPKDDHGEVVPPHRVIPPEAGWLVCPENPKEYDGRNQPWRE